MNRQDYFNYITRQLSILGYEVKQRGRLNILDMNLHSENFYAGLLNIIYGTQLKNLNSVEQNIEGIDLIDDINKIYAQVSSTTTKHKIESSLEKSIFQTKYQGYTFWFVAIVEDASSLRKKTYKNPHMVKFDPAKDILDIPALLKKVLFMADIKDMERVFSFIKDELEPQNSTNDRDAIPREVTGILPNPEILFREKEIVELSQLIQSEDNKPIIIKGLGGIGKSAIAKKIYHILKPKFNYVAWINYSGNLENDLLSSFIWPSEVNQDERLKKIYAFFQDGTSKLLFIDNFFDSGKKDSSVVKLSGTDVRIVMTSRMPSYRNFNKYDIQALSEENCIELFYYYYEYDCERKSEEIVRKLIKSVNYHTFTIELLAKSAMEEESLSEFYNKLQAIGFRYPEIEIDTDYDDLQVKMAEHLRNLFNMIGLSENQKRVLYNFAFMPSMDIPFSVKEWIHCKINDFNILVKKGWLAVHETEERKAYYMHPLIKETILLDIEDFPMDTGIEICKSIKDDSYIISGESFHSVESKLLIADSVLNCIRFEDEMLLETYYKIGDIFYKYGYFKIAKRICKKNIKLIEKYKGIDNVYYLEANGNLGSIFMAQGKYDLAEKYLKIALNMEGDYVGGYPVCNINAMNNLSWLYFQQGRFSEAETILKLAEKIQLESPEMTNESSLSVTYNHLAVIYMELKKYKEAEHYYNQSLQLALKLYGENHPEIATLYDNMAALYLKEGLYDKAEDCSKKAIEIYVLLKGENNQDTAIAYHNLASLYMVIGKDKEAELLLHKAIDIMVHCLGKYHPEVRKLYNNIAGLYCRNKQYERALEYAILVLKIERDLPINNNRFMSDNAMRIIIDAFKKSRYAKQYVFAEWLQMQLQI